MRDRALPPRQPARPERRGAAVGDPAPIERVFAKLGEKFGDLTGRVDVTIRPETSFDSTSAGSPRPRPSCAASRPRSPIRSSTASGASRPPKGVLLYGPPGTGKTLARARARHRGRGHLLPPEARHLTSKFGPNTGELLQEILGIARGGGPGGGVSRRGQRALARASAPAGAGARGERPHRGRALREARRPRATSRRPSWWPRPAAPTPSIRPWWPRAGSIAWSRCALPDASRAAGDPRACRVARRAGGGSASVRRSRLPLAPAADGRHEQGRRSRELLRRALEEKVQAAGQGHDAGLVTTQDLLRQIDVYRRIREVVEKIRYGQYL